MSAKSIFDKPFDDGTLDKLSIFRDYLIEWLPVFVAKPKPVWKTVQIFDFFAGRGKDVDGTPGSPLIAIEVINMYKHLATEHGVKIILHLNELDKKNFDILKSNVQGQTDGFEIILHNKAFEVVFDKFYDSMKKSANFLFLDQNGIKEITGGIFKRITKLSQTDFLFFISSSYFKRFSDMPEFRKYFPFDKEEMDKTNFYHIHRKVFEHYKSLIEPGKIYFLAPFSIKKEANIFGLVFGSNHTFGLEKFLKVAWRKDSLRGEANFNIDGEKIDPGRPSLFEELDIPRKRQLFENKLTNLILNSSLSQRYEIYLYGLTEGFLLKDVNSVLRKLISEKKIELTPGFELISAKLHNHLNPVSLKLL